MINDCYISKNINNLLCLKYALNQVFDLPIEIIYIIMKLYRELDPVCIILGYQGSFYSICQGIYDVRFDPKSVIKVLNEVYPNCRYYIKDLRYEGVLEHNQTCLPNVIPTFIRKKWPTSALGCYLISGSRWNHIVHGEVFHCDNTYSKFMFDKTNIVNMKMEQFKELISAWIISFNNTVI